jgi:hypothetical protein
MQLAIGKKGQNCKEAKSQRGNWQCAMDQQIILKTQKRSVAFGFFF